MNSSTSKQLQNDIVDLFCSQQKSFTSANRKTQYMFSSLDALMLNSHAFLLFISSLSACNL